MALTRLPTELLEIIITHVLPEGFESVAVTCRKIYALCIPVIRRHNALRSRFHHFTYHENPNPFPTIATAADLIRRIAVEPVVACYVRYADSKRDSPRSYIIPRGFVADADCRDDVIRLFANCPYLEQAGLDWKEYLDKIEEELNPDKLPRYSQHAAAFLLTLLPNVERLILPQYWKPLDATNKLINAFVHKTKQVHSLCDRPSLAQITRFEPYVSLVPQDRFDLGLASPFLALPRIRSFRGPSCVIMDDNHKSIVPKDPNYGFGETLESVSLVACCVDEAGIADFLKDTKRLKSLRYLHSTKYNVSPQCWDICRFVAAIERQVGSHLVELSVSIGKPFGSIAPGKASMRGFPCLRQLEVPLEIVMCKITAAACRYSTPNDSLVGGSSDYKLNCVALFVGDLVPASVSVLSLISHGADHHDKALDVMFRDFAARKEITLPALTDIHLICPNIADDFATFSYKLSCLVTLTSRASSIIYSAESAKTMQERPENEGQLPASTAATEETAEKKSVYSIPEQPSGHGMSKTQTTLLVFALCCSTFLAALDITIVTTALPTISEHFHTNAGYIWVGAAYILADAASTPVWGKVSDIWGRKPVLLIAIAVFFIGSALSATAVNMVMLIAGRTV
ncbi:hypothetical protein HO173_000430 [Letharia columbiana]|uniref:F-box domain-containing protein n=1 Tax=Letharia columbiana TaxID=112416 RepID=A0A8H6G7B0_9LECA|nr:uncharacterized protein HO173_000430 [Letharia columbiana]KAF6241719.1 hypothetical protein HO173_000430 [Letharia columbiana]